MGIRLFTGRPGSGKSYRVVDLLMGECDKYYVFHNIDGLKEYMFANGEYIKNWTEIKGFLSLQKQKEICSYIKEKYNRSVLVIVDEAQSHGFNQRNPVLLDWLSYHRHLGQDIWLVSQSSGSIAKDYYDRIEYEVRAKRGIATNQFVYQHMVEKEVYKTIRVSPKKALFAAYQSFEQGEVKKKTTPLLMYGIVLIVVAVGLGVYQIGWGIPTMFGGKKEGVAQAAIVEKKGVVEKTEKMQAKKKVAKVRESSVYRVSACIDGSVLVQAIDGGRLYDLAELIGEYYTIKCTRKGAKIVHDNKVEWYGNSNVRLSSSEGVKSEGKKGRNNSTMDN